MTAICASFADFKLIKGRKVCQLVCEVPLEQAGAALAALGGLPNPHAERWVGIAPLKEQPQGQPSPGPAGDGGSTAGVSAGFPPPQAQPRGAAAAATGPGSSNGRTAEFGSANGGSNPSPGTKPERRWDDIPPSQQAGIACGRDDFKRWVRMQAPDERWDGESVLQREDRPYSVEEEVRWYCGVSSRTELDTNPEAAARWRTLYGMFQTDTRYGDRR